MKIGVHVHKDGITILSEWNKNNDNNNNNQANI